MTAVIQTQPLTAGVPASQPNRLYQVSGGIALLYVLLIVLDMVVFAQAGQAIPAPGQAGLLDWFTLLHNQPFLGLYGLGLLNLLYTTLIIPVFLALCAAFWQEAALPAFNRALALLAAVLLCMATTLYLANNPALPMLELAEQYAAADAAHRSLIAAAGQAILARGEEFTPGSFLGFFLSGLADLLMALAMLRSRLFPRLTAWVGLLGFGLLQVFTVWASFIPPHYDMALMVASLGGLFSLAWFVLVARGFFRLSRVSL
jgi:hypothetical protein